MDLPSTDDDQEIAGVDVAEDPNDGHTSEESFTGEDDLNARKPPPPTRRSKQKQPDLPSIFTPSPEAMDFIEGNEAMPLMTELIEQFPEENLRLSECGKYITCAARSWCIDCKIFV